ncbi:MAG TPA: two-component system response regulator, partial [Syntrophobacteraceae bacterium]|nr:two-component system response regulator [Syntrophobacteraceae bacterium]
RRALHSHQGAWNISFLTRAKAALAHLADHEVDTIVTDVQMPEMDGFELIRQIREERGRLDIPIIVVTGLGDAALKRRALDLGATDLLSKPVSREDLIARVQSALRIKWQQDELKAYSEGLERLVAERTLELADSRLDVLWRLGKAAEYRDKDTGQHIIRVSLYCRVLAEALGLDRDFTDAIFLTSPLHDIGKMAIPDAILLKPGKLSDSEWVVMKCHCEAGAQILCDESLGMKIYFELQGREGGPRHQAVPLLQTAATIARSHHERWDGNGYPKGLIGEAIPLEGRIVALSDVYDALSSKRPYKAALPEAEVITVLKAEAGKHFDPAVHAAFEGLVGIFREIRHTYVEDGP